MTVKECPFCGSNHSHVRKIEVLRKHPRTGRDINVSTGYQVYCINCTARGSKEKTKSEAVKIWNNRKKA